MQIRFSRAHLNNPLEQDFHLERRLQPLVLKIGPGKPRKDYQLIAEAMRYINSGNLGEGMRVLEKSIAEAINSNASPEDYRLPTLRLMRIYIENEIVKNKELLTEERLKIFPSILDAGELFVEILLSKEESKQLTIEEKAQLGEISPQDLLSKIKEYKKVLIPLPSEASSSIERDAVEEARVTEAIFEEQKKDLPPSQSKEGALEEYLKERLFRDPKNVEILLSLGIDLRGKKHFEEALKHLERAKILAPKNIKVRHALMRTFENLKERRRETIEAVEILLRLNPQDRYSLEKLGYYFYFFWKNAYKAYIIFKFIFDNLLPDKLDPKHEDIRNGLSLAEKKLIKEKKDLPSQDQIKQTLIEELIKEAAKHLRIPFSDPEKGIGKEEEFRNLAFSFFKEKRWIEAEEKFRELFSINPNDHQVQMCLGDVLRHQGRLEEALKFYLQAKKGYPIQAMRRSTSIYSFLNQTDNLIKALLELFERDKKDRYALERLGWIMLKKGKRYTAAKIFKYILTLKFESGEAQKGLQSLKEINVEEIEVKESEIFSFVDRFIEENKDTLQKIIPSPQKLKGKRQEQFEKLIRQVDEALAEGNLDKARVIFSRIKRIFSEEPAVKKALEKYAEKLGIKGEELNENRSS